jgi:SAM-dependent methyltransferase
MTQKSSVQIEVMRKSPAHYEIFEPSGLTLASLFAALRAAGERQHGLNGKPTLANPTTDCPSHPESVAAAPGRAAEEHSVPGAGAPASHLFDSAWLEEHLSQAKERAQFQPNSPRIRWLPRQVRGLVSSCAEKLVRLIRSRSNQQTEFNYIVLALSQVFAQTLRETRADLSETRADLSETRADLSETRAELRKTRADLSETRAELCQTQTNLCQTQAVLRQNQADLRQQERRLTLFLEETRKRLPGPLVREQVQQLAKEASHTQDPRYVEFEDRFRGSRGEIRERLQVYLPILREDLSGFEGRPVLDLGCGRGEWLELVRDQGWQGRGVDSNRAMVEQCRLRGLEVTEGEVLACLRDLPDACFAAVTAFHVVEHLPVPDLLALLHETARVLRPGGVAIFETPNPENLITAASDFYRDLTHLRPLHPDTMHFLAEQHGLVRVEILRLNGHPYRDLLDLLPWHHPLAGHLNLLIELTSRHLLCAPDYALIGRKAGE